MTLPRNLTLSSARAGGGGGGNPFAAIPGYVDSIDSVPRLVALGMVWQDYEKTTPATVDDHQVLVVTCGARDYVVPAGKEPLYLSGAGASGALGLNGFSGGGSCLVYADGGTTLGTVGFAGTHGGNTFNGYESILSGDTTGGELLIGNSGGAAFYDAALFGAAGRTRVNEAAGVTFCPAAAPKRVTSWAAGDTPQTHARLVVGAGRTGYPAAPNARFWEGVILAAPVYNRVLDLAEIELLESLLSAVVG